ncbi:DUF411 domain-containing protein [Campylobacter sp. MIT 21-1685]|uniref:DUF411 domain-containing protein n=1 Tax=unclassified Campylobacter TaxID=2593542 RepID=UPI00224A7F55|nr:MULTISPECIES: DUF411 domain-containing protein [unclassified Campylobacter]MCX2682603.1 DUF411 domain-containing protein [Campylobacter sp. MIT 21-1684]MCX2750883.1 DUF411 domain-containing protein [Campylobacter sp. MIT 21-1682]MCX2807184.1 DUF411 domain-containing protein [Campylobacter sp. MIT 21-1685]
MKKQFLILVFISIVFAENKTIQLYESPYCGCCELWGNYMQNNGYKIQIHKIADLKVLKDKFAIKNEYQSCHTAVIQDYIIEGHVPENAISWLLENKPNGVFGIAAPGMPQGSLGMEQGYEEEYPVILLNKDGSHTVYGYFKGKELLRKSSY